MFEKRMNVPTIDRGERRLEVEESVRSRVIEEFRKMDCSGFKVNYILRDVPATNESPLRRMNQKSTEMTKMEIDGAGNYFAIRV